MLAIVYDKNSKDRLLLQDVPKPEPQEGEVLVKIHSVSVNAADYRSIQLGIIPKRKIFGADIAGEIVAIGSHAGKFKVSERVVGDISGCGFGGFAEYVAVPEKVLARIPEQINNDTAAALPMASVTALQGLRDKGRIKAGDKVLIVGAGGGVGNFAIQLAKSYGAEVTAVCSNQNLELVKALGADEVINYKLEDFGKVGRQYNLVLGVNGNYPFADYKRVLTKGGTYVLIGGGFSQLIKSALLGPFLALRGRGFKFLAAKPEPRDLAHVMKLVQEGKLRPVIDRSYPLQETAEAINYLKAGHSKGKVIIKIVL